jgi:hypothetical protein
MLRSRRPEGGRRAEMRAMGRGSPLPIALYSPEVRKRYNLLLELSEDVTETLGGVGRCGEIVVGCRHLELLDLGVDAEAIGAI